VGSRNSTTDHGATTAPPSSPSEVLAESKSTSPTRSMQVRLFPQNTVTLGRSPFVHPKQSAFKEILVTRDGNDRDMRMSAIGTSGGALHEARDPRGLGSWMLCNIDSAGREVGAVGVSTITAEAGNPASSRRYGAGGRGSVIAVKISAAW